MPNSLLFSAQRGHVPTALYNHLPHTILILLSLLRHDNFTVFSFWAFPGYSVTTISDESTLYFVAGAPRSNHSGQVVVYTVNSKKQSTIIDSARGKQVLRFGIYMVLCQILRKKCCLWFEVLPSDEQAAVVLDWVILWKCPVLPGCG